MTARNLLDVTDDGVQFDKGTLKVDVLDDYADFVCGDYLVYNSDGILHCTVHSALSPGDIS